MRRRRRTDDAQRSTGSSPFESALSSLLSFSALAADHHRYHLAPLRNCRCDSRGAYGQRRKLCRETRRARADTECMLQHPGPPEQERHGQTYCHRCEAGRIATAPGQIKCAACAKGTSQPATGQSACIACAKGWYQDAVGQASCVACDAHCA